MGQSSIRGKQCLLYDQCLVDIKKGYFGTSAGLDGSDDFNDTTQTSLEAFSIFQPDASQDNWFEENLTEAMAARNINLSTTLGGGVTQFRIYFAIEGNIGRYDGWYAGDKRKLPTAVARSISMSYYAGNWRCLGKVESALFPRPRSGRIAPRRVSLYEGLFSET